MKPFNVLKCLCLFTAIALVGCTKEPVASFTADKTSAKVDEEIEFTNTSEHAEEYAWDFGDGDESTAISPTHAYTEPDVFEVTLTATGKGGEHSTSMTLTVYNIVPGISIGDFYLGDNLGTQIDKITDINYYLYTWSGSDGTYLHLLLSKTAGIGFWIINNDIDDVFVSDVPFEILSEEPFDGMTEKLITFGSTFDEVTDAYGTPDDVSSSGAYTYNSGLFLGANKEKTEVDQIDIFEPGTKKSTVYHIPVDVKDIIRSGNMKSITAGDLK